MHPIYQLLPGKELATAEVEEARSSSGGPP
jgi:hypothetical protein